MYNQICCKDSLWRFCISLLKFNLFCMIGRIRIQKRNYIHRYFTRFHRFHLLIKNVLDGIFNSFKIADIHHCHFFRSAERGSGACKNFFSQHRLKFNFIVTYTWQCAFILCLYRLLNIKKQNWTIKWKTQKKKMAVEETKYLNDNSKWVSKLAY